jgi:uncharacterized protein YdeI (YjbR/CyaY-like superfamily)
MKVKEYFEKHPEYLSELNYLRNMLLKQNLEETIKWGSPVYTFEGKNIVGLSAFKSYFGLWFFQGELLKDSQHKLINAQKGKTQAMRQWRFSNIDEIEEKIIVRYVQEAIVNEKTGHKITPRKKPLIIPEELKIALSVDNELKDAFSKLTDACKREYAEYVLEAKKESTKITRLQKIIPMILNNKKLNNKYK